MGHRREGRWCPFNTLKGDFENGLITNACCFCGGHLFFNFYGILFDINGFRLSLNLKMKSFVMRKPLEGKYTVEEYLEKELVAPYKSEFYNGEIFPMGEIEGDTPLGNGWNLASAQ